MHRTTLLITISLFCVAAAQATTIALAPPNDSTGSVYTVNANDLWGSGRGIVFQMNGDEAISSVGVLQDLSNIQINYAVYRATSASGNVRTGETLLQSGGAFTSTSGLQYVDFSFAPITLLSGNFYHIEFTFSGNSNQNFFYSNQNVTWTQGNFTQLDGTAGGNTANSIVAAFRVNADPAAIPEPGPAGLLLGGLGLAGWQIRRLRKA